MRTLSAASWLAVAGACTVACATHVPGAVTAPDASTLARLRKQAEVDVRSPEGWNWLHVNAEALMSATENLVADCPAAREARERKNLSLFVEFGADGAVRRTVLAAPVDTERCIEKSLSALRVAPPPHDGFTLWFGAVPSE